MKGTSKKKNVERRGRRIAVRVGECIFPVSELQGQVVCRAESLISTFFCPVWSLHKAFLYTKDRGVSVVPYGKDSQCLSVQAFPVFPGINGMPLHFSCFPLSLQRTPGKSHRIMKLWWKINLCERSPPALLPQTRHGSRREANARWPPRARLELRSSAGFMKSRQGGFKPPSLPELRGGRGPRDRRHWKESRAVIDLPPLISRQRGRLAVSANHTAGIVCKTVASQNIF